jgi:NAD(P)-dependent dehydrogenase (short-subunit alcohol dehydrogenase family)
MSEQPVAIVTGAGSGIGRATALMLAERDYRLTLVGRRPEPLLEVSKTIGEKCCLVIPADVGQAGECEQIVGRTHRQFGRIDVLVNNAGFAPLLAIDHTPPDILDEIFRVNALGPAYLTHFAWPIFVDQKRGRIVNISTLGTIDPFAGFFGYAAAKAAVNLMAKSCAKEGRAPGIKAFAIAPGAVETQMLRANFSEAKLPKSKTLPPERIAAVILECIDGKRDAENGGTIVVNA